MIRPVALAALVLLVEPVFAQAPPLDTWKTVMESAEEQFRAGEPMYACRHATNLAHFLNEEIMKLQKSNASREMVQDVMWLEMDWQTLQHILPQMMIRNRWCLHLKRGW